LAGEPIRARPTPPWERAWKWAGRYPAGASLVAVVAAGFVVLAVGSAILANIVVQLRQSQAQARAQLTSLAEASETAYRLADEMAAMISYAKSIGDRKTAANLSAKAENAFRSAVDNFRQLAREHPKDSTFIIGLGQSCAAMGRH